MITRVKTKHQLNSVLIGTILGGSYLAKNKAGTKAYLSTVQKPAHKDYLIWKRDLISNYFSTQFRYINNGGYPAFQLTTRYEGRLKYLYQDFYLNSGIKVVRQNILNRVTDLSLAIWYMDDGNLSLGRKNGLINRRNIFLNTHSFGFEGNQLIQAWLFKKYGIESNINKDKKSYRLRFNTTNTKKFINIVKPYVARIPCMFYKIDMKYKTEDGLKRTDS